MEMCTVNSVVNIPYSSKLSLEKRVIELCSQSQFVYK